MFHLAWPGAKAGAVVKAALPLLTPELKRRLETWQRQRHFKHAILDAFEAFERDPDNREFSSAFFDNRFLTGFAAPMLARFLNRRGKRTDPAELAEAWQAQYHMPMHQLPGATAAAARFIGLLEEKLAEDPVFDAILRDRDIAETAGAVKDLLQQAKETEQRIRRQEAVNMFKLLMAAARGYEFAARARLRVEDTEAAEENAARRYDDAVLGLRALGHPNVEELETLFETGVSDNYYTLCSALTSGGSGQVEHDNLIQGIAALRQRLRELLAPTSG